MEGHVSKHLPCFQGFNICKSGWEEGWCPSCWALYKIWSPSLPTRWELRAFWNVWSLPPPFFLFYFSLPFLLLDCCVGCSPVPHAILLLSPSVGLLPARLIRWVSLGFDVIVQVLFFCSALLSSLCVLCPERYQFLNTMLSIVTAQRPSHYDLKDTRPDAFIYTG